MKAKQLGGHLLFWAVIMFTYALSEWGYRNNFWEAILFELLFLPVRLVAVYVNWFVLIPSYLYRNRILVYLLLLLLLLFALAIAQRYITLYWGYPVFFPEWVSTTQPIEPLVFFRIVQNVVIIVSPVAFSTGIKIFMDWYAEKNRARQLAIEKREAELKYLKSQINPHFLFNTLNNLYGLSIERSQKVPRLILQLSDFLNYSLYESAADQISVAKEMKLIEDFVALETERYEQRVQVNWSIDETALDDLISPLLFVPLVENAFKHGVREALQQAQIDISLQRQGDWLTIQVVNTIPDDGVDDEPGIGLKNLTRRLELLYPGRYTLQAAEEDGIYRARLRLKVR